MWQPSNEFSDEERDLIKISENIIIHGVLSENVFDIPVYARKTKRINGMRMCLLNVDGNKWLL